MKYWRSIATLVFPLCCLALAYAAPNNHINEAISEFTTTSAVDTSTLSLQSRQPKADDNDGTPCPDLTKIKSKETASEHCFGKVFAQCPNAQTVCYNAAVADEKSVCADVSIAPTTIARTSLASLVLAAIGLAIV